MDSPGFQRPHRLLPVVAGWVHLLPERFTRLHAKYRTPVNSIPFLGGITIATSVVVLPGLGSRGRPRWTQYDLSLYPAISYSKLICLHSRASSFLLLGSPPPKPVRLPSLPITRWHGMMMGMGLQPFANPTARTALGLPMR